MVVVLEKVQCYFLDRDDNILFVRDDALTFVVGEADLELDCSFPIDTEKPIQQGMKIGFYDIDDKLVFYEIRTVDEDAITMTTAIYAEHALIAELLEDPLTDVRVSNATALQALSAVLNGSRWHPRNTVETSQASCRFWYINRWEALKKIREKWQIAFAFSWAIDDTGIVNRYVDIISRDPINRGKRFDTLKDISSLKVSYDDTEVCTALYGRGAEEKTDEKDQDEEGNTYDHKITFASVVWSTKKGNPADKPSGQQYVEDVQATALYGRAGRMRAQFIDFSNTTDPVELLILTWNALQLVNKPKITIKATVADLEKIWGYKHEAVRINDWGLVIADSTKAQIETVVVDIKRDYINPQLTKIIFGNKVITISDIQAEYQAHTRKVEEEARRAEGTATAAAEKVEQTQQQLLIEFAGAQSAIYSSLFMTAEELEIEFTNGLSDLHSQIHVTAEELQTEFAKSNSQIYSSIRQTASDLQVEFGSTASDLYSSIKASAESLETEFHKADSAIYSKIQQTASGLETEFGNSLSGTYAYIKSTADQIKTELYASQSTVYSTIQQTAQGLQTEFGNTASGIYSSISATASDLKSEFSKADSKIYSSIKTSADGIKTEFGNAMSGVYSSVSQTASDLQSEFHSADSAIYSRIQQNETAINLVVSKAGSGNKINTASIVAAINNDDSSEVAVDADHVFITGKTKLSGHVTVDDGKFLVKTILAVQGSTAAKTVTVNDGKVTALTLQIRNGGSLIFSDTTGGENNPLTVTRNDFNGMIKTMSKANNVLTLTRYSGLSETVHDIISDVSVTSGKVLTITKTDNTTINFSKATALYYSGTISADGQQKKAGWSSGTFTVIATQTNKVTATGQDETNEVGRASTTLKSIVLNGTPTQEQTRKKYMSASLRVLYDNGDSESDGTDTGLKAQTVGIDASPVYNYGWSEARKAVVWPIAQTTNAYMDITVPSATVDGTPETKRFTVRSAQNEAYITVEGSGDTWRDYAMVTHNQYNYGWKAAHDAIVWPNPSTPSASMTITTPKSAPSPTPNTEGTTYTLSVDENYAYLKTGSGSSEKTVAKVPNSYGVPESDVTQGTGAITGSWGLDSSDATAYNKYNLSASIPIMAGSTKLFDATAAEHLSVTAASNIALSKGSLTKAIVDGSQVSYAGSYSIQKTGSGGKVKIGGVTTNFSPAVTPLSLSLELAKPTASMFSFSWSEGKYTYQTYATVNVDGSKTLERTETGWSLTPTDAIRYGTSLVTNGTPTWTGDTGVTINGTTGQNKHQYKLTTSGRKNSQGNADEDVYYLNPTDAIDYGAASVMPGIDAAGWKWVESGNNWSLTNAVTASNPNSTKKNTLNVGLPTISVSSVTNTDVTVVASDGTTEKVIATATHTKYADGQNSVNVSGPTWAGTTATDSRKVTFSTSAGTGSSAEMVLTLSAYANNFQWNSSGTNAGKYTYDVIGNVNDGNGVKLTKTASGVTFTPTGAINYGKTLVTVKSVVRVENCDYDDDLGTAYDDVIVTLWDGTTETKTLTIQDVDFSDAYEAGLNGQSAPAYLDFEIPLEDENGTVIDTYDWRCTNLSDIYQQGVDDATPVTTGQYVYTTQQAPFVRTIGSTIVSNVKWGNLLANTEVKYLSTYTASQKTGIGNTTIQVTYYYVVYDGYTGYIRQSYLGEVHSPAQGDLGGWVSKPEKTIVSIEVDVLQHVGYSGDVYIYMDPQKGPLDQYLSEFSSNPMTVTDSNTGKYLELINGYYANHPVSVYSGTITHRARLKVNYDTGTEYVVIEFTSNAVAPYQTGWDIIEIRNHWDMAIPISFTDTNGRSLTMTCNNSERFSTMTTTGEDASLYISGSVTYAYDPSYPSTSTCRFRVRKYYSDGTYVDAVVQKEAKRDPVPQYEIQYVDIISGPVHDQTYLRGTVPIQLAPMYNWSNGGNNYSKNSSYATSFSTWGSNSGYATADIGTYFSKIRQGYYATNNTESERGSYCPHKMIIKVTESNGFDSRSTNYLVTFQSLYVS